MFSWWARITRRGPLYDGRAQAAIDDAIRAIEETAAEVGAQKVRVYLGRYLQYPTGYYMSQIRATQAPAGWRVHDSGVIYGHWLAGSGSRNFPVTQFRGYPHWTLATHDLNAQAEDIAEFVMRRYLPRMQ